MFRLSSGTPCLVSMCVFCVCVCVCVREGERGREREREREREELYKRERKALVWVLCCLDVVHRQQPVKMFRLSSGTPCLVSMCVCVFCVCVCKGGREREREREREWCGSYAIWMFRPSSAACQDVSSFIRYPMFSECVSVRERERERGLYTRGRKALV